MTKADRSALSIKVETLGL